MQTNHVKLTEPWSFDAQEDILAGSSVKSAAQPNTLTTKPIATGSSVIALRFSEGVMLAADNLVSFGSMARFQNVERIKSVGKSTLIAVSGEISDYQHLSNKIDQLLISESYNSDGQELEAPHIASYLRTTLYKKRCELKPFWNAIIIAGPEHLSFVDLYGTTYESEAIATGLGAYLAIPLLRKHTENDAWKELSKEDARKIIDDAMRVLYYRDARSLNKFTVSSITSSGAEFEQDQSVDTVWSFAEKNYGYGTQTV